MRQLVRPTPPVVNRPVAPPSVAPAAPEPHEGFKTHLWDAITNNWRRKRIYAERSGGASKGLSNQLIVGELISLPFALWFDHQAKRFQDRGIPIVSGDFVSMKQIKSPDAPPKYRNVASDESFKQVEAGVAAYKQTLEAALSRNDFLGASAATYALIQSIEAREAAEGCHFAMYKHVAESVGIAALHAADYAKASHGATNPLAVSFIKVQAKSLDLIASIDRKAQELHRQGIGIIVNDVPDIPFKREFEARLARGFRP